MIMAGRGRRLVAEKENPMKPAEPAKPALLSNIVPSFLSIVNDINVTGANTKQFSEIRNSVKEIFPSKEALRNTLSDSHSKALSDPYFGEKLVLALEQISNYEVDGMLLRNELLSFIQNDFKTKETLFQSDRKKFLSAVLLLGGVFNRIKICGEPIEILGVALLEYFDLLIKGDEEEFKILTKQIFVNGEKLRKINKFELLEHDLRKIITNENLNAKCKCWILLAIDIISNEWKPLQGIVKNFYVANLGEEYNKLEALIPSDRSAHLTSPKNAIKDISEKKNKTESTFSKTENYQKNLSKNLSDLNIKPDKGHKDKVQSPPGKGNKKDSWKSSGAVRKTGHDDRFEKEENFYGVQKPRQPKAENLRKNYNEMKGLKRGSEMSTDFDHMTENQSVPGSENGK